MSQFVRNRPMVRSLRRMASEFRRPTYATAGGSGVNALQQILSTDIVTGGSFGVSLRPAVGFTVLVVGDAGTHQVEQVTPTFAHAWTPGGSYTIVAANNAVTDDIAYDASAADVQTALNAVCNIYSVTGAAGGPYTVTCLFAQVIQALALGTNSLTPAGSATFNGATATAATIQTGLQTFASIGSGNALVSGGFGNSYAVNEITDIDLHGAVSGTFTCVLSGIFGIAADASWDQAALQSYLDTNWPGIISANVSGGHLLLTLVGGGYQRKDVAGIYGASIIENDVTGHGVSVSLYRRGVSNQYTVTFQGGLAAQPIPLLVTDDTVLTQAAGTVNVSQTTPGGTSTYAVQSYAFTYTTGGGAAIPTGGNFTLAGGGGIISASDDAATAAATWASDVGSIGATANGAVNAVSTLTITNTQTGSVALDTVASSSMTASAAGDNGTSGFADGTDGTSATFTFVFSNGPSTGGTFNISGTGWSLTSGTEGDGSATYTQSVPGALGSAPSYTNTLTNGTSDPVTDDGGSFADGNDPTAWTQGISLTGAHRDGGSLVFDGSHAYNESGSGSGSANGGYTYTADGAGDWALTGSITGSGKTALTPDSSGVTADITVTASQDTPGGSGAAEVDLLTFPAATGGTFTIAVLGVGTTDAITYVTDVPTLLSNINAALTALSSGLATATGSDPTLITLSFSAPGPQTVTVDGSGLTKHASLTVSSLRDGSTG